ncbi:MAG: DUF1415 domain-containing protein [Pirellula sp.]
MSAAEMRTYVFGKFGKLSVYRQFGLIPRPPRTQFLNMMSTDEEIIEATVTWLEVVVIGLNLCPFAKAIHTKNQIRYAVSSTCESDMVLADLKRELSLLVETEPHLVESTLLIFPDAFPEFIRYNHFLDLCNLLLEEMELDGVIQIASFHPSYQFADTNYDDVTNCTNRSPYPMLHLLREDSVTRAVDSYLESDRIVERNIATMKAIGQAKMDALMGIRQPDSNNLEMAVEKKSSLAAEESAS